MIDDLAILKSEYAKHKLFKLVTKYDYILQRLYNTASLSRFNIHPSLNFKHWQWGDKAVKYMFWGNLSIISSPQGKIHPFQTTHFTSP